MIQVRAVVERSSGPVFAPFPEHRGHRHHNALGVIATRVVPGDRLQLYTTYTHPGSVRTIGGKLVIPKPHEVVKKKRALACYKSQPGIETVMSRWDGDGLDEFLCS